MQSRNSNAAPSYFISVASLCAAFAFIATRNSPYDVPDNLEVVTKKFAAAMRKSDFGEIAPDFYEIKVADFPEKVRNALSNIPEYLAWNVPKNGVNDGAQKNLFVVSSRFSDKPHPDDDFIDLDAFYREFLNLVAAIDKGSI